MPDGPLDPGSLEGADLVRWYQRSPWEIEQERQAARQKQYDDLFGPIRSHAQDVGGADENIPQSSSDADDPDGGRGVPAFSDWQTWPGPWIYLGQSTGSNSVPGLLGDWPTILTQREAAPSSGSDVGQGPDQGQPAGPDTGATNPYPRTAPTDLDRQLWPTGNSSPLMPASWHFPTQSQLAAPQPGSQGRSQQSPNPQSKLVQQAVQPGPTGISTPIRPSNGFFSYLFGGPVPIKDSVGNTTGYYDHQAANVGLKITGAYAAAAPLFQPGAWMGDLLAEVAPGAAGAIAEGIQDAVVDGPAAKFHDHHPVPKFMGGDENQELVPLPEKLHVNLHSNLTGALREAGFPRVGGRGGSRVDWARYFIENPGRREDALALLRRVTSDFDRAHGTSVSSKLKSVIGKTKGPGDPSPK